MLEGRAMTNNLTPDIEQARHFLKILDEGAEQFTFQTFPDAGKERGYLTRVLHGTPVEHFDTLAELNRKGAGIFASVNETDLRGRKKKNIVRIRSIWQEDDAKGSKPLPCPPHMVVSSSPGKYHRYVLTDTTQLEEFDDVMQTMVEEYGSDPNAADISRVLRLPGFYHMKNPASPHMVRIIEESGELPYSWETVKELFPPKINGQKKSKVNLFVPVLVGERNSTLAQIAGKCLSMGFTDQDAMTYCLGFNKGLPAPLEEKEVETVVTSICQRHHENNPEGVNAKALEIGAVINTLAGLTPVQYELIRKEKAQELGIRPAVLDSEVKARRQPAQKDETLLFVEDEPWPEPVDPALLLTEIVDIIKRFIICSPSVTVAAALWVVMTWIMDCIQVAPLAIITAPEMRCGKTMFLSLLQRLVARAIVASNISGSSVFRTIDAFHPTLLIDEADSFMKDNEELRGIINSGHSRDSAYVIRTVGEDFTPTKFSTWSAKAIAGIGHLPPTLMDRGIILELRRKLPHERVERLRNADPELFDALRSKLARFAADYSEQVRLARPPLPESLNDRQQDNWETLLKVAIMAGGHWFDTATQTAKTLSGDDTASPTIGAELLADIKEIFDSRSDGRIRTEDLIKELCADSEKPWGSYNKGNAIRPRQVASRLKAFGILSKNLRIGSSVAKGYEKSQFEEAFLRYIPLPPSESATRLQPSSDAGFSVAGALFDSPAVADKKEDNIPDSLGCYVVADKIPPQGQNRIKEVEI
jgi:putative DNA primase/helicase